MRFEPIERPLICRYVVEKLLEARERGEKYIEISLDLGRTIKRCSIDDDGVLIGDEIVEWGHLERVLRREREIFMVEGGELIELSISADHFYKLVFVKWGHPPTLEIDGIHMHRVKDVTPDLDAELKVRLLGRLRCMRVLDTCMGLGYTAIAALRRGACRITTIEVDENVISLARLNPWSRELSDERVDLRIGDAMDLILDYDEEFDAVIHDPPRISLAGNLYSLEFYRRIAKALKPGGRVVHYVGQPGIMKGRRIWRGVMERMRRAGFQVSYDERSRCVFGRRIP